MGLRSKLPIGTSITHKATALIVARGLMSATADWFCYKTIERIEAADARVFQHIAPARLALSEAKGALGDFGLSVYKMSSYEDRAQVVEEASSMNGQFR